MHVDEFLKEVALLLGLQPRPFQRRGVRRKVERRLSEVGLSNVDQYLARIKEDPEEKAHLSKILTVTISSFFRDQEVFRTIETSVIPAILKQKGSGDFRIWSIGCASGEEPYSLSLLWKKRFEEAWRQMDLSIVGTDLNEGLLKRAKEGIYKRSSLREVPPEVLDNFFKREGEDYVLDPCVRESVQFRRHNILRDNAIPEMDLVLCRNLAFTYFSKETQTDVLRKIAQSLKEEGHLVIGKDESLPLMFPTLFVPVFPEERIYQKFKKR